MRIRLAIASFLALMVALVVVGIAATSQADNHTERIEVPICDVEDGSTMPLCLWHGSDDRDYLNYNYGEGFMIVAVHFD